MFWDTSTHPELGLIRHPQGTFSIALSPDDQFLAIDGGRGKITIEHLSSITDKPANTDALLTTAISKSRESNHHILTSRALV
ncbi:hypothetical protein OG21DRAFT_1518102 [Imleria badia]|nr:hypothetical protein OG21DRAFT_1518102 [Imleria badia]